jgi:hypothetical protein
LSNSARNRAKVVKSNHDSHFLAFVSFSIVASRSEIDEGLSIDLNVHVTGVIAVS